MHKSRVLTQLQKRWPIQLRGKTIGWWLYFNQNMKLLNVRSYHKCLIFGSILSMKFLLCSLCHSAC